MSVESHWITKTRAKAHPRIQQVFIWCPLGSCWVSCKLQKEASHALRHIYKCTLQERSGVVCRGLLVQDSHQIHSAVDYDTLSAT